MARLRSPEYESNGAKVRTYDIVASSIINLRAGQHNAQARACEIASGAPLRIQSANSDAVLWLASKPLLATEN